MLKEPYNGRLEQRDPPADVPVIEERSPTPFWRSERMVPILLALLAFSFALHFATWVVIFGVRDVIRQQSSDMATQLGQAQNEVLTFNVNLNQPMPIKATVPVKKQLNVPIKTTINIDKTFQIPFDTPLGSFSLPLPVKVDVPVNTTVPVNIDENVDINTNVDLNLNVPVSIPVKQTSLFTYLERLKQALLDLNKRLS